MIARAVIGANFGDEGKGLVTDYLADKGGGSIVVRFNGGAQSGHTVVVSAGRGSDPPLRHVFHHFGSGTFCGLPTYLSKFFVVNPILYFMELEKLQKLGLQPRVYAHPNCLVTTFADMMINQRKEDARGAGRHGSCGVGVHETIVRSGLPRLSITMSDLWSNRNLEPVLNEICTTYAMFRTGSAIDLPHAIGKFMQGCKMLADRISPMGIKQCRDPLFEGAQGLLLDQGNKEFFPHVTHSNTGMKNIRALCHEAGIDEIEPYYVSRTYLTRHGAGPLPGEDATMRFEDSTNLAHPYQGSLRFAPLDHAALIKRCSLDAGGAPFKIVYTHCDQSPRPSGGFTLLSWGPTRNDVEAFNREALNVERVTS